MPSPQIDWAAEAAKFGGSVATQPPPVIDHSAASMSAAYPGSASSPEAVALHAGYRTPDGWHSTAGDERSRADNTLLGMPPEFAALSALAVTRAAAVPAANVIGRARAAVVAAGAQAAPVIKYEVTKHALESLGVSSSIAIPIAMVVSGYKKGAKATPTEAAPAPTAEAATPAAAAPAVEAAPTVAPPETAPAGSVPVPAAARATNQMWQELRQAGLKPTEATEAFRLLSQGVAPAEVQARILAARPSAASVAPETPAAPVAMSPARTLNELAIAARRAKVKLSQEDYQALIPLVQQGATPADAVAKLPALQMQRIAGTMTDAQVAAEIAARKGNRSPKRD